MPLLNLFLATGSLLLLLMFLVWLLSLVLKNASIVDIFWGIGFLVISWLAFAFTPQGYLWRKQLIVAFITIWSLRLAIHIGARNWGKPEDFRYAKWRKESGTSWWWVSFFKVFLPQGALMWILSIPILAAQTSGFPAILTPLDYIGACLWIFGFLFESIGDSQLIRFKMDKSS